MSTVKDIAKDMGMNQEQVDDADATASYELSKFAEENFHGIEYEVWEDGVLVMGEGNEAAEKRLDEEYFRLFRAAAAKKMIK